jgi:hypothetical protein
MTTTTDPTIRAFEVHVPEEDLADLRRRMLRDMCQRRHTASHPSFQDQSRPRDGRSRPGDICAGGVKGRVGCKAFDQMAGELKA